MPVLAAGGWRYEQMLAAVEANMPLIVGLALAGLVVAVPVGLYAVALLNEGWRSGR